MSVPLNKSLAAKVVGSAIAEKLFSVGNIRNCGIGRATGRRMTEGKQFTRQLFLQQEHAQQKKVTFNTMDETSAPR
ncbi:hypothetical protein AB8989_07770 [Yersinia hibernica]|uniref:hypothetical protein n=1 Tax=Yersinia hibernica TaxID=2339259 RepID=UPI003D003689